MMSKGSVDGPFVETIRRTCFASDGDEYSEDDSDIKKRFYGMKPTLSIRLNIPPTVGFIRGGSDSEWSDGAPGDRSRYSTGRCIL